MLTKVSCDEVAASAKTCQDRRSEQAIWQHTLVSIYFHSHLCTQRKKVKIRLYLRDRQDKKMEAHKHRQDMGLLDRLLRKNLRDLRHAEAVFMHKVLSECQKGFSGAVKARSKQGVLLRGLQWHKSPGEKSISTGVIRTSTHFNSHTQCCF